MIDFSRVSPVREKSDSPLTALFSVPGLNSIISMTYDSITKWEVRVNYTGNGGEELISFSPSIYDGLEEAMKAIEDWYNLNDGSAWPEQPGVVSWNWQRRSGF